MMRDTQVAARIAARSVDQSTEEAAPAGSGLSVESLYKEFNGVPVVKGIDLDVPAGTMVSLLGPSGCGKSTTLRMIAGLEQPTGGTIRASGEVLTANGKQLPPEHRNMGMVFQTYALWPHKDVFSNIVYGPKRQKRARNEIEKDVLEVLDLVGMKEYASRYPSQLSGGQQQRVALARSIATNPKILLFDEPLSNLDAVLRESMRFEIRSLQQRIGITGVYVTHSQDEALALSDRLAIMREGLIVQEGPPEEVYERPRNEFVAGFIGLANVFELTDMARDGDALIGTMTGGQRVRVASRVESWQGEESGDASKVKVAIRPEKMRLETEDGRGEGPADGTSLVGEVIRTNFTGNIVDYFVRVADNLEFRIQSTPPVTAAPGDKVRVRFLSEHAVYLDD